MFVDVCDTFYINSANKKDEKRKKRRSEEGGGKGEGRRGECEVCTWDERVFRGCGSIAREGRVVGEHLDSIV